MTPPLGPHIPTLSTHRRRHFCLLGRTESRRPRPLEVSPRTRAATPPSASTTPLPLPSLRTIDRVDPCSLLTSTTRSPPQLGPVGPIKKTRTGERNGSRPRRGPSARGSRARSREQSSTAHARCTFSGPPSPLCFFPFAHRGCVSHPSMVHRNRPFRTRKTLHPAHGRLDGRAR